MEEMIKRIIDMDKKARDITDAAKREKLDSEEEITEKAAQLRNEYLDRARRRIQINNEADRTIMEQNWRKREAQFADQMKQMDQAYAEHSEEWVNTIMKHVLEG